MRFVKITSLYLALGIFTILLTTKIIAQQPSDPFNLTVSPIFLDLTSQPGQKLEEKVRIRNNSNQTLNLRVKVYKLLSRNEDGATAIDEPTNQDQYISWLKLDQPTVTANPQEWTDVHFSIDIPTDASFGYYYALSIGTEADPNEQATAKIQSEVVIPILLTVQRDGAKAEATLLDFKPKTLVYEDLPVDFQVRLSNSGNVHIKPRGNIFIKGPNGQDLAILEVNESISSILPGEKRLFTSSWKDGFIVREPIIENGRELTNKDGSIKTRTKINWNKLTDIRIGPYTANLLMVFDNGTRDVTLETSTTFWVIPYKFIGGVIVSLIIFIIFIRLLLKQYVKKQLKNYRR